MLWLDTGALEHKTIWLYLMPPVLLCFINLQILWFLLNSGFDFSSSRETILKVGRAEAFWRDYNVKIFSLLDEDIPFFTLISHECTETTWYVISSLWWLMQYVFVYCCYKFLSVLISNMLNTDIYITNSNKTSLESWF